MAGKAIAGLIKLELPAGKATPSPPVGPALGQRGLNIMDFCRAFNEATKDIEQGVPTPVVITAYQDRSFVFETKTPPASYFLRQAAGLSKGGSTPGRQTVGQVTPTQLREIALKKMTDLNTTDIEAATRMIMGSARAMGLSVRDEG